MAAVHMPINTVHHGVTFCAHSNVYGSFATPLGSHKEHGFSHDTEHDSETLYFIDDCAVGFLPGGSSCTAGTGGGGFVLRSAFFFCAGNIHIHDTGDRDYVQRITVGCFTVCHVLF